jgi:choice-of-anchor C domain-containing protein
MNKRVITLDLFGNLLSVSREARSDTFVVPLRKYPTAKRITVRRIRGDIRVYGLALYPVVGEAEADTEALQQLSNLLHDPLSPENLLLKRLKKFSAPGPKPTSLPAAAQLTSMADNQRQGPAEKDSGVNSLVNGSFEEGPRSDGLSVEPLWAGSTDLRGWVVTRGSVDSEGTDGWNAVEGRYSLDMNGSPGVGAIRQTFRTVPGQVYSVSFHVAGNPSVASVMKLRAQAAGQQADFSFETIGRRRPDIGWVLCHWKFRAVAAETTIEFISLFTASAYEGPALGDVRVIPATALPVAPQ